MTWTELAEAIAKMTPKQKNSPVTIFDKQSDEFAVPELSFANEAETELYWNGEPYLSIK